MALEAKHIAATGLPNCEDVAVAYDRLMARDPEFVNDLILVIQNYACIHFAERFTKMDPTDFDDFVSKQPRAIQPGAIKTLKRI